MIPTTLLGPLSHERSRNLARVFGSDGILMHIEVSELLLGLLRCLQAAWPESNQAALSSASWNLNTLRCGLWLYCIYHAIPKSGSSVLVALATDKRNDFICTSASSLRFGLQRSKPVDPSQ